MTCSDGVRSFSELSRFLTRCKLWKRAVSWLWSPLGQREDFHDQPRLRAGQLGMARMSCQPVGVTRCISPAGRPVRGDPQCPAHEKRTRRLRNQLSEYAQLAVPALSAIPVVGTTAQGVAANLIQLRADNCAPSVPCKRCSTT